MSTPQTKKPCENMRILNSVSRSGYDVYLFGEAAFDVKHNLKRPLKTVQYRCAHKVSEPDWYYVVDEAAYYFDKVKDNVFALQLYDLLCFAIRENNNELVTEIILQNGRINTDKVRERYFSLYRINTPYHLEDVVRNVKDSNINRFLISQGLTYTQFVSSVPMLCDALGCREDELDKEIEKLI